MKDDIVATYDYYTLEQAERILNRRNARRKRKKKIEERNAYLCVTMASLFTAGMLFYWIIFGYIQ